MFHYFLNKPSSGFVALLSGRLLQLAANGLIGLFLPVYLLINFDYQAELVMLWYLVAHLGYILLMPSGARFMSRFGLRRSLRLSVVVEGLFLCFVFLIPQNPPLFIGLSVAFSILLKLLFWLPYEVDFAKFSDATDRGKEVGLLWAANALLGIAMPALGGFLIAYYGYQTLFITVIALFLSPLLPFMFLPHTREKFEWGVWETFRNLFRRENRDLVFSNMANGAESGVAMVVWPIFIWQIMQGNYLEVGAVSSLIVLVEVAAQLAAGRYTDKADKRRLLHWGSAFYALGWLAKAFVTSGFQVFVVGVYHQLAKIFKETPFETINYELAAGRGHYVDEYTVIKNLGIQIGRVIILALAILVAWSIGLNWVFVLAAIATLFVNLL